MNKCTAHTTIACLSLIVFAVGAFGDGVTAPTMQRFGQAMAMREAQLDILPSGMVATPQQTTLSSHLENKNPSEQWTRNSGIAQSSVDECDEFGRPIIRASTSRRQSVSNTSPLQQQQHRTQSTEDYTASSTSSKVPKSSSNKLRVVKFAQAVHEPSSPSLYQTSANLNSGNTWMQTMKEQDVLGSWISTTAPTFKKRNNDALLAASVGQSTQANSATRVSGDGSAVSSKILPNSLKEGTANSVAATGKSSLVTAQSGQGQELVDKPMTHVSNNEEELVNSELTQENVSKPFISSQAQSQSATNNGIDAEPTKSKSIHNSVSPSINDSSPNSKKDKFLSTSRRFAPPSRSDNRSEKKKEQGSFQQSAGVDGASDNRSKTAGAAVNSDAMKSNSNSSNNGLSGANKGSSRNVGTSSASAPSTGSNKSVDTVDGKGSTESGNVSGETDRSQSSANNNAQNLGSISSPDETGVAQSSVALNNTGLATASDVTKTPDFSEPSSLAKKSSPTKSTVSAPNSKIIKANQNAKTSTPGSSADSFQNNGLIGTNGSNHTGPAGTKVNGGVNQNRAAQNGLNQFSRSEAGDNANQINPTKAGSNQLSSSEAGGNPKQINPTKTSPKQFSLSKAGDNVKQLNPAQTGSNQFDQSEAGVNSNQIGSAQAGANQLGSSEAGGNANQMNSTEDGPKQFSLSKTSDKAYPINSDEVGSNQFGSSEASGNTNQTSLAKAGDSTNQNSPTNAGGLVNQKDSSTANQVDNTTDSADAVDSANTTGRGTGSNSPVDLNSALDNQNQAAVNNTSNGSTGATLADSVGKTSNAASDKSQEDRSDQVSEVKIGNGQTASWLPDAKTKVNIMPSQHSPFSSPMSKSLFPVFNTNGTQLSAFNANKVARTILTTNSSSNKTDDSSSSSANVAREQNERINASPLLFNSEGEALSADEVRAVANVYNPTKKSSASQSQNDSKSNDKLEDKESNDDIDSFNAAGEKLSPLEKRKIARAILEEADLVSSSAASQSMLTPKEKERIEAVQTRLFDQEGRKLKPQQVYRIAKSIENEDDKKLNQENSSLNGNALQASNTPNNASTMNNTNSIPSANMTSNINNDTNNGNNNSSDFNNSIGNTTAGIGSNETRNLNETEPEAFSKNGTLLSPQETFNRAYEMLSMPSPSNSSKLFNRDGSSLTPEQLFAIVESEENDGSAREARRDLYTPKANETKNVPKNSSSADVSREKDSPSNQTSLDGTEFRSNDQMKPKIASNSSSVSPQRQLFKQNGKPLSDNDLRNLVGTDTLDTIDERPEKQLFNANGKKMSSKEVRELLDDEQAAFDSEGKQLSSQERRRRAQDIMKTEQNNSTSPILFDENNEPLDSNTLNELARGEVEMDVFNKDGEKMSAKDARKAAQKVMSGRVPQSTSATNQTDSSNRSADTQPLFNNNGTMSTVFDASGKPIPESMVRDAARKALDELDDYDNESKKANADDENVDDKMYIVVGDETSEFDSDDLDDEHEPKDLQLLLDALKAKRNELNEKKAKKNEENKLKQMSPEMKQKMALQLAALSALTPESDESQPSSSVSEQLNALSPKQKTAIAEQIRELTLNSPSEKSNEVRGTKRKLYSASEDNSIN